MCVLNSGSSKSCGKSPETHFYWSPLGSIFKRIPIGIFIGILQLKHCRKRHYLLFCTVAIHFHTSTTKGSKMLILGWAQGQNRLSFLMKSVCENGIRNKKISLVFTSIILPPKHWEREESTGKVWENKTFQSQVFLTYFGGSRNPYSSQNSKHENSEFT